MGLYSRTSGRRRWSRLTVIPVALALVATGQPAIAEGGDEPPAALAAESFPEPTTVTLLTGDRVSMHTGGGGPPRVDVEPAPRPGGFVPQFHVTVHDGDVRVIPSDMVSLVPDRVDRELFNITALVDAGLDDASSDSIPVILTHAGDEEVGLAAAPIPAARQVRALSSVQATAAAVDKARAGEVASVLAQAADAGSRSGATALLAGVEKIWLDRPVRTLLDQSTDQISATAAWAAGLDGAGVTVAVLDTGVDGTHEDLAGRVVASADFTFADRPHNPPALGVAAEDRHGHGTHVAGTVAGTGAASDGTYRGVAPGASLLNGKVLDHTGSGHLSWLIEGMQWAAESGADIINLSLGTDGPTPLLIDAVEQLTAAHGTLFVVAAGNAGCDLCIGSPADAPSALAIGAVDSGDALAWFSSRGPTPETRLLKPELTAPGVEITAARSSLAHGEGPYQDISGTSMAAPHVSGVAALLLQAHPQFGPEELKGALMSTAVPNEDLTVYEQGAGRVDVAQLLDAAVLATSPVLDLGSVPHPQEDHSPMRRTASYRNVSDEPVTLELSAELADYAGVPVGQTVVTVEPSQLTVPAGATAEVEVTIAVAAVGAGQFGGQVVAEGPDGLVLRTPVSFHNEREVVEVSFAATMRDGREIRAFAPYLYNVDTGEEPHFEMCSDGSWLDNPCRRVPVGTYAVMSFLTTTAGWHDGPPDSLFAPPRHTALVGDPEVTIDRDLTVTLDAREAVEVIVDTPAHETKPNLGAAAMIAWYREPVTGPSFNAYVANSPGAQLEERLFLQPTDPVTEGDFAAFTRWRLDAPRITLSVDGHQAPELDPYYYRRDFFSEYPLHTGAAALPLADAGRADPADLDGVDLDGALALVRRSDHLPVATQVAHVAAAGASLVAIYNDVPGVNTNPGAFNLPLEVPTVRLSHEEGMALRDLLAGGPVTVHAEGNPASPYLYDLVYTEHGEVPDDLHYTADPDELVRVDRDFTTQLDDNPTYAEVTWPLQPWEDHSFSTWRRLFDTPRSRVDFHTVGQQWAHGLRVPQDLVQNVQLVFESPFTHYQPDQRNILSMMRQPLTPGMPPGRPVARGEDLLRVPLVGLHDAEGNFGSLFDMPGFDSSVRLWLGDELLHESDRGSAEGDAGLHPLVELPPEERTYRLDYQFQNAQPWASLSTSARTQWTFRSAHVDAVRHGVQVIPLLTLAYDIPLDLTNRSLPPEERRGPPTIGITPGHVPGADAPAITGARLWVSFDDGESWQQRPARGGGGDTYEFVVPDGAGSGFVSLRVEAWDADGNRIEQEVIRAYAVSG